MMQIRISVDQAAVMAKEYGHQQTVPCKQEHWVKRVHGRSQGLAMGMVLTLADSSVTLNGGHSYSSFDGEHNCTHGIVLKIQLLEFLAYKSQRLLSYQSMKFTEEILNNQT